MPVDPADRRVIWTIGHSTRALDELVRLLRAHGVAHLIDVRTLPRSRRNPQFDRTTLPETLAAFGITYAHMRGLGGLRRPNPHSRNLAWRNAGFRGYADYMQTPDFATSLDALIGSAAVRPTAAMCAEAVPWRCHRSLLADALIVRSIGVEHILSEAKSELHRLTLWARVDGLTITYPGLGV